MRSLSPPNGDHFTEFVVLAEDRPPLRALEDEIRDRYAVYVTKQEKLETVAPANRSMIERTAFKNAYTTLRNRLNKEMNKGVAEVELCPYCLSEYARDWDHFLPQNNFPDFAVYRPNLIRVCTSCNRKKGSHLTVRPRKALNPYFDPIDDISFLECEVSTNPLLTAIFRVNPPAGADEYFTNLIREHFKSYKLARKYRAQASKRLTNFIRSIQFETKHGMRLTQDLINREIDKLIYVENLPPNHWQLALARALRATPKLCDYLRNRIDAASASDVV